MPPKRTGPLRPETWAAVMLGLLGLCGLGIVAVFLVGALSLGKLLLVLLLLLLAAVSVLARYLSSPARRD
jgi:heme A synthase